MDLDERDILDYLKGFPGQFVAYKQVCRRAGGKRKFRRDHAWAIPIIKRLVQKQVLEADGANHCRLVPPGGAPPKKRWVSPQLQRILKAAGKNVDGVFEIPESGETDASPGGQHQQKSE